MALVGCVLWFFLGILYYFSGPSCSKLTVSLVKVSLKTLIVKYGIYANIVDEKNVSSLHLQKLLTFFSSKNTCELDSVLTRTANILTTNELVKLTTL